jgi:hypothetical protein
MLKLSLPSYVDRVSLMLPITAPEAVTSERVSLRNPEELLLAVNMWVKRDRYSSMTLSSLSENSRALLSTSSFRLSI